MRRWLTLSLLLAAALVRAQQTPPPGQAPASTFTPEMKADVLKGIADIVTQRAFQPGTDFTKWADFVTARKEKIDAAKDETEFTRIMNESLREFGLSHFRLMTPRVAARRGQTTTVGTGAGFTKDENGLKVSRVTDDSPAKQLGLEVGDVITKVDGKKPDDGAALDGDEGKKFQVEVKKANGEVKTVEVELKKYSTVRKETLTWIGEDAAVLRVFTFSTGYSRENVEILVKEANSKAKYLVLDLRSNGGGAVNNLNHLLSLLMPDGTSYGTFISRRLADDYKKEKPEGVMTPEAIAEWAPNKTKTRKRGVDPFLGKIGVLTNRGSASASEICTAALKENVGAKQVGTRTAGAVLASTYGRLPGGFQLQFPVSDFVTAKGVRLEKRPCVPDAEVTETRAADGSDPAVTKAIELIKAG